MLIDHSDLGYILEITAREDEWVTRGGCNRSLKSCIHMQNNAPNSRSGRCFAGILLHCSIEGALLQPPLAYKPWALLAGSYAKNAL